MGARKQRPLLHAADRKLRRTLLRIAVGFGVLALLVIVAEATDSLVSRLVGRETYPYLLQLFLISAGGGVLLAIVGNARDEASRRQARAAAIQVLHREMDKAYRALKKTKRTLRAHRLHSAAAAQESHAAGRGGARHRIPRPVFEKAMEDLLDAQLELETICEHIWQRNDILRQDRLERMREPLHYVARYFHDVHEDFEKGAVRLEDDHYVIDDAPNLNDYLRSRKEASGGRPASIEAELGRLRDEDEPLPARAKALAALIAASPAEPGDGQGKVRYADVANACFDLLSAELAQVRANLLS